MAVAGPLGAVNGSADQFTLVSTAKFTTDAARGAAGFHLN